MNKMAATVETVHGLLHELKNGMGKISSDMSVHKVPRTTSSSKKRPLMEDQDDNPVVEEVQVIISPKKLFNDQFRKSVTGYNAIGLTNVPTETFLYDWYTKDLGTVSKNGVALRNAHWCLVTGSKTCNDSVGEAKSIMKLLQSLMTANQLFDVTTAPPNAANDSRYSEWEIKVRGIARTVTVLANDFLIFMEGKIGNVKTLSVGAMARRWKMQKYEEPNKDDVAMLRALRAASCSAKSSVGTVKFKNALRNASELVVSV
jgi:hypothetical protein